MKPWCSAVMAAVLLASVTSSFAAGPLSPYSGTYVGLTYPQSELAHAHSAYLALRLHSDGLITGEGTVGGVERPIKGAIGADGKSAITFLGTDGLGYGAKNYYLNNTFHLTFDFGAQPPSVSGCAEKPEGTLVFGRLVTFDSHNPAPQAGTYTVVFTADHPANAPEGASFGFLKVTIAGDIRMQTYLADGATASHRTQLPAGGVWPMYMGRYEGKGSILGNLSLATDAPEQPSGTVIWTKPKRASNSAYPLGWTNFMTLFGSRYVPLSKTSPPLPFQQGVIVFSGADLAVPYSVPFTIPGPTKLVTSKGPGLVLKLTPSNGMFSGAFTHPATSKKTGFKGAVLQEQGVGYGYFLTRSKLSGLVYLGPMP